MRQRRFSPSSSSGGSLIVIPDARALARAIRDDIGDGSAISRRCRPSVVEERGSAGAEALRPIFFWAAFRRPRAVAPGRGCGHIRGRAFGPTRVLRRRAVVVRGPRAAARAKLRGALRAPLATGCRAVHYWRSHSLAHLARDLRRAVPRDGAANGATPPHPDAAPRPATDAQACRVPHGQGCASMAEPARAGISVCGAARDCRLKADSRRRRSGLSEGLLMRPRNTAQIWRQLRPRNITSPPSPWHRLRQGLPIRPQPAGSRQGARATDADHPRSLWERNPARIAALAGFLVLEGRLNRAGSSPAGFLCPSSTLESLSRRSSMAADGR
jgi:hypothetical protein